MDQVYALGVICIEFIQYWFEDWSEYFEFVNNLSNPHYVLQYMFPVVTVFDSVFGSQLLTVIAFGGWLNSILKWLFLEDRPYWWVRETTFYTNTERPVLLQTAQTCETGPGSPSGHSMTAASVLVLMIMWISHIINDRKWNLWWWKRSVLPVFGAALGLVMLARMFVATHFPHQCLLGALVGTFMSPALCIYVTDPVVWQYGPRAHAAAAARRHVLAALAVMLLSVAVYCGLKLCGIDPHYTVKLAFRWCAQPESIHVSTTPMFALVQTCAALLAAACCVTPAVAKYRHYTKNRSILISMFATALSVIAFHQLEENITRNNVLVFYGMHFVLNFVKPLVLLRAVPEAAMWPYGRLKEKIQ